MTFDELEKITALVEEYLLTLDNTMKDEWWDTTRGIHEDGVYGFLAWLGQKIGEGI